MIKNAMANSRQKQLATICLAPFSFFCPRRMLISGAPPTPIQLAKEVIRVTMGPQTPTPASARPPVPGILPMYMRSTMLYSTLTN